MLLVDVVGNAAKIAPLQIAATWVKVGVIWPFAVILTEEVLATG